MSNDNEKKIPRWVLILIKLMPSILTIMVTLGFFATIYILMVVKIDADVKDFVYIMVGVLGAAFTQAFAYFLGKIYQKNIESGK